MFTSMTQVQSCYSLHSNDSRWRPNLRIDMNQVTILKFLGFTWKKWQIYWESLPFLDLHISAIARLVVDGVAKPVVVSVVVEADDSHASTLWKSLLFPNLPQLLVLGSRLSNSCWTDSFWFSSISSFARFAKSTTDFTISFGAFSIFMIPFMRGMH